MKSRFTIFKAVNGLFYFTLTAATGEKILESQGHITKLACHQGILLAMIRVNYNNSFRKQKSSNGQYYFTLVTDSGKIIGTSELYLSARSRNRTIEEVQRAADAAGVEVMC